MKRTLKLLERAKAYESYITSQIQSRSSLYIDDLELLRNKARQQFIELRVDSFSSSHQSQQSNGKMTAEVALFENMLHKLALKYRFKPMQTAQNQRYYTR